MCSSALCSVAKSSTRNALSNWPLLHFTKDPTHLSSTTTNTTILCSRIFYEHWTTFIEHSTSMIFLSFIIFTIVNHHMLSWKPHFAMITPRALKVLNKGYSLTTFQNGASLRMLFSNPYIHAAKRHILVSMCIVSNEHSSRAKRLQSRRARLSQILSWRGARACVRG